MNIFKNQSYHLLKKKPTSAKTRLVPIHTVEIYKKKKYLFSEVDVFLKSPIQSLILSISPCLMELLVWTYKHAVYQRFNQSSYRRNVDQSRVRDSHSEIKFLSLPMLHL